MGLKRIKPLLPNGAMTIISAKANVSYTEVSRMFNGLTSKKTSIVLKATLDYLMELKHNQETALKEISETVK